MLVKNNETRFSVCCNSRFDGHHTSLSLSLSSCKILSSFFTLHIFKHEPQSVTKIN